MNNDTLCVLQHPHLGYTKVIIRQDGYQTFVYGVTGSGHADFFMPMLETSVPVTKEQALEQIGSQEKAW